MNKYDLSILIPARNEMFLARTIQDILEHIEGKTEIIVGLDGCWAEPVIEDDHRITIIHHSDSIGQRAITNECAKLSNAKYVMKVDEHCSFDQGFDVKMMKKMQDDLTMVPIMRNLWAFDWKCIKCGKRWYQSPTYTIEKKDGNEIKIPVKCPECGSESYKRKIVWVGKEKPQSRSYCFDSEPHFQYFKDYTRRPEYFKMLEETGLTETMSLQGSCFMMTRDKYWELNVCDEEFGSWGSQGIEVACKTWLSGGRVVVNHTTWYAHMFRTQGNDFGFPYQQHGNKVEAAKMFAKDIFFNNKWDKAIHPLSWLVEKFWPVPGWTQEALDNIKQ